MSAAVRTIAATALAVVLLPGQTWSLPPGFSVETVHSGLNFPTAIAFAPDGRLFCLERGGRVLTYASAAAETASVWTQLPTQVTTEGGALGMAIHPSFPDSPYVFFFHTRGSPTYNQVVRLTDQFGIGIDNTVIIGALPARTLHNGGRLAFGPDHTLYATYGDQLTPAAARDSSNIRGKILRLGTTPGIPPDNPYGPSNPAVLVGVRNAFGICFDPATGTGYFTDNGPACDDELNILIHHGDYGWGPEDSCGTHPPGTVPPLARITPAPTSCCVYRGLAYSGFSGNLFFGSFPGNPTIGGIYRVVFRAGAPDQVDSLQAFYQGEQVVDVAVGREGWLWFTTQTSIKRIRPPANTAVGEFPGAQQIAAIPNPFIRSVTLSFVPTSDVLRVDVLDLGGRRMCAWNGPIGGSVVWDGLDSTRRPTAPGVYLVRALTLRGSTTRRIVRLSR